MPKGDGCFCKMYGLLWQWVQAVQEATAGIWECMPIEGLIDLIGTPWIALIISVFKVKSIMLIYSIKICLSLLWEQSRANNFVFTVSMIILMLNLLLVEYHLYWLQDCAHVYSTALDTNRWIKSVFQIKYVIWSLVFLPLYH